MFPRPCIVAPPLQHLLLSHRLSARIAAGCKERTVVLVLLQLRKQVPCTQAGSVVSLPFWPHCQVSSAFFHRASRESLYTAVRESTLVQMMLYQGWKNGNVHLLCHNLSVIAVFAVTMQALTPAKCMPCGKLFCKDIGSHRDHGLLYSFNVKGKGVPFIPCFRLQHQEYFQWSVTAHPRWC